MASTTQERHFHVKLRRLSTCRAKTDDASKAVRPACISAVSSGGAEPNSKYNDSYGQITPVPKTAVYNVDIFLANQSTTSSK
jgi:hypothetical protein